MLDKGLLFLCVILNVGAQFLLKAGMTEVGPVEVNRTIATRLIAMVGNAHLWAGLASYGAGFAIYSIVLSRIELSRAYPISSAAAIVLITGASIVFLRETLTLGKVAGVLFCTAGIFLIFR